MTIIQSVDPDFRIFQVSFDELIEIQMEAEARGWATRWSSVDSLRRQVSEGEVILQSLMREEREGVVRSYRCIALFSAPHDRDGGGIATLDLSPQRFESTKRIDRDLDVRKALVRIFSLALGGISVISKE